MQNRFLIERVAWMYYKSKKNQMEIARILGLSRSKVSRLLTQAEKMGIVEARVNLKNKQYYPEVEQSLLKAFNLKDCFVIPSLPEMSDEFFSEVAAQYVESLLENEDFVGVAWGNTLKKVFSRLDDQRDFSSLTVVQLLGGLAAAEPSLNVYDIMKFFQNSRCVYLYAPAIVNCAETKKYLLREPQIRRVFEMMINVKKAFLGIGDISPHASLYKAGFLSNDQMDYLIEKGAVGDVVGRFFDLNGNPIEWEVNNRIIGITLEQLKNIPFRIGISYGMRKVKPIVGALKGKFVNILVTDYYTALEVSKIAQMLSENN